MSKKVIHTDKGTPPGGHYSQGIQFKDLLFASGQVPVDPSSGEIRNSSIQEETRQTLTNLSAIAKAGGSSLDHTLKITVFLTDMSLFPEFNAVYQEFFPDNPPARSTVEVTNLLRDVHIEIDAIIAIPAS